MRVFNLYLKLLKKNLATILIYVAVFTLFAIILTGSNSGTTTSFQGVKVPVAWINEDESSPLLENLKDYLSNYVDFEDVEEKNIPDALYFREIYMAIRVPAGFTDAYFAGEDAILSYEEIPDAMTSITIKRAINNFLKYVLIFKEELPTAEMDEIFTLVKDSLAKEIIAERAHTLNKEFIWANNYYNILSYLIVVINISIIGNIMTQLRKKELKNRMSISPYPLGKTNLELLLGNLVFTLAFTTLMVGLSFILYPNGMREPTATLYIVNVYVFSLTSLTLAYLISLIAKNPEVIQGVNNVVGLSTSFLGGAFVPQAYLSSSVLAFAHILPNYYYIYNNDTVSKYYSFDWGYLKNYILFLVIQLLFATFFMILSIIVVRKQSRSEN